MGAAAANGKIYVVGGLNATSGIESGLVYHPNNDTWTPIAGMPGARAYMGIAALNAVSYTHLTLPTTPYV